MGALGAAGLSNSKSNAPKELQLCYGIVVNLMFPIQDVLIDMYFGFVFLSYICANRLH